MRWLPLPHVRLFLGLLSYKVTDFANAFWSGKVVKSITGYYRLANDAKAKGKEREFNGMVDVYVKTIKSDGFVGLYRGFVISCVGIFIYRGMYFGLYDSLKPILLVSGTAWRVFRDERAYLTSCLAGRQQQRHS